MAERKRGRKEGGGTKMIHWFNWMGDAFRLPKQEALEEGHARSGETTRSISDVWG